MLGRHGRRGRRCRPRRARRRDGRGREVDDGQVGGRRGPGARRLHPGERPGDEVDVVLVGEAGVVGEREQAVVQQDHPDRALVAPGREALGAQAGQHEAGHHVGHDHHVGAVHLADESRSGGRVGERQHGVGVGVEHEPEREDGVQDRLDRGGRGRGVERRRLQLVGHGAVGQRGQLGQPGDAVEPQRGEALPLDRGHVPAAALDVQHVDRVAEHVDLAGLDRAVAAAGQHERGVRPEQPGRVHQQVEVVGSRRRVLVTPPTLHARSSSPARLTRHPDPATVRIATWRSEVLIPAARPPGAVPPATR